MGRAVIAGAIGLIEALGFTARQHPMPAHLHGVAYALVPAEHRRARPALSGARIPMFAVSAGRNSETAQWRLAARAAQLRLGRNGHGVGVGPGHPAAVRDALCDAVE